MQTLYIRHDTSLYEVRCGRKTGQPNKIQIHEINLFEHGSIARPVRWDEIEQEVQLKIQRDIHQRFNQE